MGIILNLTSEKHDVKLWTATNCVRKGAIAEYCGHGDELKDIKRRKYRS